MVDVCLVNVRKIYNRPMDPMACSGYVSYNQPVRQGNVQLKKNTSTSGTSNSNTAPIPESLEVRKWYGLDYNPPPSKGRGSRFLKCHHSGGNCKPASKVWVLTWKMFHQINSANKTRRPIIPTFKRGVLAHKWYGVVSRCLLQMLHD